MQDNKNDRCVCCGCDTGIPHDTPISERQWYISGSGQLCGECYLSLYVQQSDDAGTISDDELNKLIRLCKR